MHLSIVFIFMFTTRRHLFYLTSGLKVFSLKFTPDLFLYESADKPVKLNERLDDDAKKSKASKFNKKSKSKQKQRQQTTEDEELLTAADNNDDDCSAAKCLKPLGECFRVWQ
jgi:hypothetical protein